ncbi:MAG: UDP-N-acetylmuramate dehydrogenase [Bacteroidota bacterium]|jgi:UDP-N-acetylmuramate dehydrogenase|nr:UDP-N-acetylmuramate dehydrogenase [Bacteroidota bacterium]HHU96987.1 UDP-N-acetylmuramate dehydrogenase [Petrimonas sp.]
MIIKHNVQLKPYNSFRTKALAKLFCEPATLDELIEVIRTHPHEEKLLLGGGFNLFFTKDFDGLVIKPAMEMVETVFEDEQQVEIEVGAGMEWDALVEHCVGRGYAGLENLSLIPSTVGACPVQNIGAYGAEVSEVITRVKAVNLKSGEVEVFSNEECRFGYRESLFKRHPHYAIASVTFRLSKSFTYREKYTDLNRELEGIPNPTLTQVREAVIRTRTRKLPDYHVLPNAGSFFKNPLLTREEKEELQKILPDAPIYNTGGGRFKTSAAYLIDKAGFKGQRRGQVGTYERHSLVVVNHGTEEGREIVSFAREIQQEVKKRFGVTLEPEVQIF